MSDWDDWEDVFFDDEFDEEFETSRKIIIAVSSTIGAIVLLTILGLCAFGCCGSYFAIRQLREYRERNSVHNKMHLLLLFINQVQFPMSLSSVNSPSDPSFNPSAPYNHGSSPYTPLYGQYPANVSTNYNSGKISPLVKINYLFRFQPSNTL